MWRTAWDAVAPLILLAHQLVKRADTRPAVRASEDGLTSEALFQRLRATHTQHSLDYT